MIIATFGAFTFYQVGNQAMIQRMLAARSTWDALMGLVFAQFINFLRPLVTCFLGLVVYHWIYVMHQARAAGEADLAFTFALGKFAPAWGVRGIVVAGLIAAVMAALSAQVNSASTLFSTDIYKKFIHKEAGDHEMVRVGRIASFTVLLLAAVISPVVGTVRHLQVLPVHAHRHRRSFHGDRPDGRSLEARQLRRGAVRPGRRRVHHGARCWRFSAATSGAFPSCTSSTSAASPRWSSCSALPSVSLRPPRPITPRLPRTSGAATAGAYDEGVRRPWYQQLKLWCGIVTVIWLSSIGGSGKRGDLDFNHEHFVRGRPSGRHQNAHAGARRRCTPSRATRCCSAWPPTATSALRRCRRRRSPPCDIGEALKAAQR